MKRSRPVTLDFNEKKEPHEIAQMLVDSWQPLLQGCDTAESLNEMLVFCVASILRDDQSLLESVPQGDAMLLAQKTGNGIAFKMAGTPGDLCQILLAGLNEPDFRAIYFEALILHKFTWKK